MENSQSLLPPFFGRFCLILSSLNIIYTDMERRWGWGQGLKNNSLEKSKVYGNSYRTFWQLSSCRKW